MLLTNTVLKLGFAGVMLTGLYGQQLDRELIRKMEQLAADAMSLDAVPALSIAIARNGELQWSAAYGLQDLENSVPAQRATAFRIASISKPITAVLALRLAAEGKLNLDAPIQHYVPQFPLKEATITVRHLLGHQSGIRHYRNYEEINSARHFARLSDALVLFQDDPLTHPPGTKFVYSTFAYTLLGVALEAACGMTFDECLRERVLTPAGMHRTTRDSVRQLIPHRARGYGREGSGTVINTDLVDTSNKVPGGGLVSTAEDLIRFALAVRGTALLDDAVRTSLWTSQKLPDGSSTGYGLGWSIEREQPLLVGHGGGQAGASSMLLLAPEPGDAVAVLCNMSGPTCSGSPNACWQRSRKGIDRLLSSLQNGAGCGSDTTCYSHASRTATGPLRAIGLPVR